MWLKSECSKISSLLWDYAGQRLAVRETAQVEQHLERCPGCREQAEAYRQTVGMLAAVRHQPVPASQTSWHELRTKLDAPKRPSALRSADLLPRLTLFGAGTALTAMLLVVVYNGGAHRPAANTPHTDDVVRAVPAPTPETVPAPEANAETPEKPAIVASRDLLTPFMPGITAFIASHSQFTDAPVAPPPAAPRSPVRPVRRVVKTRLTSNRHGSSATYTAQLDGDAEPSRTAGREFVLSPVTTQTDAETAPTYVMKSIPTGQGGTLASGGDGTEDGKPW